MGHTQQPGMLASQSIKKMPIKIVGIGYPYDPMIDLDNNHLMQLIGLEVDAYSFDGESDLFFERGDVAVMATDLIGHLLLVDKNDLAEMIDFLNRRPGADDLVFVFPEEAYKIL